MPKIQKHKGQVMLSLIISTIVGLIVLLKLIFSDLGGGQSMVDSVKEGAKNAKEIHDAMDEILNDVNKPSKNKENIVL